MTYVAAAAELSRRALEGTYWRIEDSGGSGTGGDSSRRPPVPAVAAPAGAGGNGNSGGTGSQMPVPTYAETTGGVAHTWTNSSG